MTNQSPIINAPNLYVTGYQLTRTGNRTLALQPGAARNSDDTNDIILPGTYNVVGLNLNADIVGANGIDGGTIAANAGYYIFIIGDSTKYRPTAGLISTFQFTPRLPVGYDMFRRIGFASTDGSANFSPFDQAGTGIERTTFFDTAVTLLTAGVATAFTTVQLTFNVPATSHSGIAWLDLAFTANAATNQAQFRTGGSAAATGSVRWGAGVAAVQVGQVCVPYQTIGGVPQFQYKVSSASDALTIGLAGYTESLYAITQQGAP